MTGVSPPGRRHLSIRQRLSLGNTVTALLLLLAAGIAIWQVNRLTSAVDALHAARERATAALRVHQSSAELTAIISRLLPVEDAAVFETEVAEAIETLKQRHAALAALTEKAAQDQAAYPLMKHVSQHIDSVIGIAETMVRQASAGQWPSVRVRVGVLIRDHQQVASETDELVKLATDMEKVAAVQVASARRAALLYPSAGILLAIALAMLLSWRTRLSITRPIEQLMEGAALLAAGFLDKRVAIEGPDELNQLAAAFNQMANRLQVSHLELEQRVEERTAENVRLIHEMQQTLQELTQERNMLDATLNALPDLLFEVDRQGHIVDFRAPNPEMLYRPPQEFLGQAVEDVLPEEAARVIMDALRQAAETGRQAGAIYPLHTPAGAYWFELSIAAKGDPGQPDSHFIAMARDITARVQAEEALRRHAGEVQARNEELDAFSHTVAHDLQNPLGIIVGFAHALEDDRAALPEEEVHRYLHTIAHQGRKMSSIINELLLLAGVRQKEVEAEPLDMASIVSEARACLTDLIAQRQAEIILPDADAWPVALGYAPWIEEVWVNYLSNAIKYGGQPPRVELGADPLSLEGPGEGTGGGMIRFWVRDNGQGLSLEQQARLFTPFTQLNQAHAIGHGLGLSIARRIVNKLGGQVGLESELGKGSLFWFTLPKAFTDPEK